VLGELDDVAAERAGRAGDGEARAAREVHQAERQVGGEAVHGQARRLDQGHAVRQRGDLADGNADVLGLGAACAVGFGVGDDSGTDGEAGGVGSEGVDVAGEVHAGDVRRGDVGHVVGDDAGAQRQVSRVHGGRRDLDAHLAGAGPGRGSSTTVSTSGEP
jgi:hypothetical protein